MPPVFLALIIGYTLGSVPFGVILTRLFGAGDLRQIGSGNIGATNVLRTGRKGLALATLLLDGAKGSVAVLIGRAISHDLAMIAGAAAFIGHLYPVWLGFRGGKGVATLLGVALATNLVVAIIYALVWVASLAITRTSSLSGLAAAVSAPVTAYALGTSRETMIFAGLSLMIIWKHADNIKRIANGTEPRVGQKQV